MVTETTDNIRVHVHQWAQVKRYVFSHPHGHAMLEITKEPVPRLMGERALIFSLAVDDDHRRQGIATELLDFAEAIAEAEGLESVAMEWSEEDTPVEILEWYTRRGYAEMAFSNGCSLLRKTLKT